MVYDGALTLGQVVDWEERLVPHLQPRQEASGQEAAMTLDLRCTPHVNVTPLIPT
jgi:hypothetical protein